MSHPDSAAPLDAVPRRPMNVRIRNHRGTTVIGGYEHALELSESAAFVWRQIDGVRTLREIGRLMAGEYDIGEESAAHDVAELAAELAAYDLLELG
ncbi:PqqD family protein [Nonomuraea sp. NPDC050404]|uniref:PqqD family protein n=1 Tax=Nonomuraea sp. NPDC050404 TaxID=3155783 RepID=UPI00340FEEF9